MFHGAHSSTVVAMAFIPLNFLVAFSLCLPAILAKTVTYNWAVTWVSANPDGEHVRPVIGINGQWPCPTLKASIGDKVVVNVQNQLGNQSTALHWHGLYQKGTAAMDGPVGVTQCAIPPGGSQTYSFTINQPGTYFYHSHAGGQYPDGLRGPIIIDDPNTNFEYDDEIVITLSDWYHDQIPLLTNYYLDPVQNPDGGEPVPYSALLNDGQNTKLNVQPGKTYFLRIINMAAFSQSYLHFDQHKMTIVEIDGIYTEHKEVDSLYIAVAQRYGVLLRTKHNTATNYAALATLDTTMYDNVPGYLDPNVTAYLVYDDKKALPSSLVINEFETIDDFTLTPYDKLHLYDGTPDQTIVLNLDFFERDGQNRAGFNNVTYLMQKVPSLFTAMTVGAAAENPVVYGVNANAFVVKGGQLVEIVINNYDTGGHPIHLHGHAAQLVARAPGVYRPPSPGEPHRHDHHLGGQPKTQASAMGYKGDTSKMPRIPMRRDTWIVAAAGYTVLRFMADNPGVWFIHCHMEWHLEAGLAAMIIEDPLSLQKSQEIPDAWKTQCQKQGMAISGNAAGNMQNFTDLTGANTVSPPLPWS